MFLLISVFDDLWQPSSGFLVIFSKFYGKYASRRWSGLVGSGFPLMRCAVVLLTSLRFVSIQQTMSDTGRCSERQFLPPMATAAAVRSHHYRSFRRIDGSSLYRVSYRCSIASPNEASPTIVTPPPASFSISIPHPLFHSTRSSPPQRHHDQSLPFPLHPPVPGEGRPTASRSGPAGTWSWTPFSCEPQQAVSRL